METTMCKAHSSLPFSFYDPVNPVDSLERWHNQLNKLIKSLKIEYLNTQDYFLKISEACNPCLFLTSRNVQGNSVAKRPTKLLNLLTYCLVLDNDNDNL